MFKDMVLKSRLPILILGGLVAIGNLGCEPTGVVVDPINGKYIVFSDPNDPRLLQFAGENGETITLFGDRDAEGQPSRITSIFMQQFYELGTSQGAWVHLDDQDRVARLVGVDGGAISFEWTTDTTVALNAISGDSTAQVNTVVELEDTPRRKIPDHFPASPLSSLKSIATEADKPATHADIKSTLFVVNLRRCGEEPEAKEVDSVSVTIQSTTPPITFPATRQESGRYAAKISTTLGEPDPAMTQKICTSLGKIAVRIYRDPGYAQRLQEQLCGKLAAAMDAAGIQGVPGQSLQAACWDGFTALKAAVTIIEAVEQDAIKAGKPLEEIMSENICSQLKEEIELMVPDDSGPVLVTAKAIVRGSGTKESAAIDITEALVLAGSVPPPQTTIDFGDDPQVISAETIPADPAPGEGYTFRVKMSCVSSTREYIISVQGSDGYENTVDYPAGWGDTFEVSVPGGAENVQDKIYFGDKTFDTTLRLITVVF